MKDRLKTWLWRWGPALVMMALIFFASSLPKGKVPQFGLGDMLVKKGGHALGYSLLGAAYWRGLAFGRRPAGRFMFLAIGGACLYALTDEYHQSFVGGRNASLTDVSIDTLGAMVGVVIMRLAARRGRGA